jgi:hypothetical protein
MVGVMLPCLPPMERPGGSDASDGMWARGARRSDFAISHNVHQTLVRGGTARWA